MLTLKMFSNASRGAGAVKIIEVSSVTIIHYPDGAAQITAEPDHCYYVGNVDAAKDRDKAFAVLDSVAKPSVDVEVAMRERVSGNDYPTAEDVIWWSEAVVENANGRTSQIVRPSYLHASPPPVANQRQYRS